MTRAEAAKLIRKWKGSTPAMRLAFLVWWVVVIPATAFGQPLAVDRITPQLPTSAERLAADIVSWATVATAVALDTKVSWDSADRGHAFRMQGARVLVTYAAVLTAKRLIGRTRPCAPSCGADNPNFSFFSGHTTLAFSTVGGPRLAVSLPLAISTGGLRIAAGKHWLTDVLTGAGVGLLTSRLR